MPRRYFVMVGSVAALAVAAVAILVRYRGVATAPRPLIIYLRVLDNASGAPVRDAQARVVGQDTAASSLTDLNGVALLKIAVRPHQEQLIQVRVSADGYTEFLENLMAATHQSGNAGDNEGEVEVSVRLDRVSIVRAPPEQATVLQVCHFYGEASQGGQAWNKDEECVIPHVESLDVGFHQHDFICCGGGASASTTNANIPAGLEVRASGGHYWAVLRPRLEGDHFQIHTYCGPEPAPGAGCNVDVQVIAHYR